MKIGDKVKSKGITSPTTTGTVVGIIDAASYIEAYVAGIDMSAWHVPFPEWPTKTVCLIKKDFSELPYHPDDIKKFKLEGVWDDVVVNTPVRMKYVWFPVDELEAHDWIDELEKQL